jgi:hypothetical protein
MKIQGLYYKVMVGIFTVAALIFSVSFAFSEYLEVRKLNIEALATWNACVADSNLGDKAYEFCRQKCSDNYMFKKPFDWGTADAGQPDGDE